MILYDTIPLPNGLTLTIWNDSREIAAKTNRVELVAQMDISFEPTFFSDGEDYDKLVRTVGPKGLFEYRKIRAFVKTSEQETIFQDLLAAFKENSLPYLSQDAFPRRFAIAKLRDIEQNWYQYRTIHDEEDQ